MVKRHRLIRDENERSRGFVRIRCYGLLANRKDKEHYHLQENGLRSGRSRDVRSVGIWPTLFDEWLKMPKTSLNPWRSDLLILTIFRI
jgi:hypothetical protein